MATRKITITLPEEQLKEVQALIARNAAPNLSAFVKRAVDVAIQDAAGWRAMLAQDMEATGGPLTDKERVWVDSFLQPRRPRKPGGRKAA